MEKDDLFTVTLCKADWQRVVQALRNEAFHLTQESNRAHEKGSQDYAEVLWEECAYHNAVASHIDFLIPEDND